MTEGVAVVGMACRFPGARTPEEFMENLCRGLDSVVPEARWKRADASPIPRPPFPGRAAGALADVDLFDAAYFGVTPREAEVMDPQQRLFLESAAEALQRAGSDTGEGARVGVYAGMGVNAYFLERVLPSRRAMDGAAFQAVAMNEKDFLATQVSYRLNLTGPSLTVQTACSTSLVAVSLACEALLGHQCDVALAGGSAVKADPGYGSFLEEGGIAAADGRCRTFDAGAGGTVAGSGVGVVVLKRLADALAEGDHVHAVIRGTALNNDGARKVGFAAPSVEGQAAVVAEALSVAGVSPGTIGFVEAHGTGTRLGDPIEVAALAKAFGSTPPGSCALGSLKTNVGHTDAAAGVAGLIKAVLAVEQGRIPPTLHFETPNPALRLDETPFFVNPETIPWRSSPRRAGVSSFGIGGTNAHVVVEEAPRREPSPDEARPQVIVLSARTPTALDRSALRLADHLDARADLPLADVAWTLQTGRRRLAHRRVVAARDRAETAAVLRGERRGAWTAASEADDLDVAFMFPGQGAQHVGMGRDLYESEPVFRREMDRCADLLRRHLGVDLREVLYPAPGREAEAAELLSTTLYTQPALFVVEHALARLWMSWGIRPVALIGHSLGEYVAACLAGVLSIEEAIELVALRARLMQDLAEGAMLAVAVPGRDLEPLLPQGVSLAAVNAPESCVASGATAAIDALDRALAENGVERKRLHVARAFHSEMMDPLLVPFEEAIGRLKLHPPRIPVVSNLTGMPLRPEEATDPGYWSRHLRQTVRFADGVARLLEEPRLALLEVGPGRTLASLALRQSPRERVVLASTAEAVGTREALGRLWLAGARPDWSGVHAPGRRRKVLAPTYPFERQRYWIDPPPPSEPQAADARVRVRGWRRALPPPRPPARERWLVVGGSNALVNRLRERGLDAEGTPPVRSRADCDVLLERLGPAHVAYLDDTLEGILPLASALGAARLVVVTRGSQDVTGEEPLTGTALAGAARALGCRLVDADPAWDEAALAPRLAAELPAGDPVVALRGPHRWCPHEEAVTAQADPGVDPLAQALVEAVRGSRQADLTTPAAIVRIQPDVARDDVRGLADAARVEEEAMAKLQASGARVVVASTGGALGAIAVAAAHRAARSGGTWTVVESEAWERIDPADIAAALALGIPHAVLTPPGREEPPRETYERPSLASARVAPRNALEERLVALWEEAFGFQGIGVEDDFFDLGGHSLLATRIVAGVRDDFDVDVELSRFFEARTVADFARTLEEVLGKKVEALTEEEAQAALDAR